jgi:glutamate synthase (NADPH/NADH) large chain
VRPPEGSPFVAEDNVIVGNTVLYGATSGRAFFRGLAGERFAVRNSGALAVVEGVGDHGCEYMTGGTVVILGPVGRNLAAGMSGGTTYVLDLREARVNAEMVDLEPLDPEDVDVVHHLVQRHTDETGSAVGRALLADWAQAAGRFTKVMPRDYKHVLTARAAALESGFDEDSQETLDAIMEASRG